MESEILYSYLVHLLKVTKSKFGCNHSVFVVRVWWWGLHFWWSVCFEPPLEGIMKMYDMSLKPLVWRLWLLVSVGPCLSHPHLHVIKLRFTSRGWKYACLWQLRPLTQGFNCSSSHNTRWEFFSRVMSPFKLKVFFFLYLSHSLKILISVSKNGLPPFYEVSYLLTLHL